jgi:hypothetical protein
LSLLKEKHPKLRINFLGDGDSAWEAAKIGDVVGFQESPQKQLKNVHWVIASSYLAILDSLAAGRKVFSVYSDPIKKKYLYSHPMSNYLAISYTANELVEKIDKYMTNPKWSLPEIQQSQRWALKQTWSNLAHKYLDLWKTRS